MLINFVKSMFLDKECFLICTKLIEQWRSDFRVSIVFFKMITFVLEQASLDCSGDSSSEVGSVSSTSFISAVSSQEDIALVDLHMQLNKPITDSPLLMSSYINHMTQV